MVGWPDGKSRVAREPPLALHQGHISRPKADFVEDSWESTCDFPRLGSDVPVGSDERSCCPTSETAVSASETAVSASEKAVLASVVDGTEKVTRAPSRPRLRPRCGNPARNRGFGRDRGRFFWED